MTSNQRGLGKKRASSLVITLLAITVLAIIVVAFVQAAIMARVNAKTYRDILQANQSAEAGLDSANAQILLAVNANQGFVVGSTNVPDGRYPITVIGRENLTNTTQLMPLVSGPVDLLASFGATNWANFSTYANKRIAARPQEAVDLNTAQHFIQTTTDTNLYRATWVTLTNVTGAQTNYARYAYVVTDEQARLNPALHTGMGSGLGQTADWYSGPQDVALTNAGWPILTREQANAALAITNALALSPETMAQVMTSRTNYETTKHFLTALANPTYDVIPQWLTDGGKPKYNINDLATNTAYGATASDRARSLSLIIQKHLPKFSSRDAALRGTNELLYLDRLSANIIDYIDDDFASTMVDRSGTTEPAGRDLFPLPVLIAERLERTACAPQATPATTTIATQLYVQVWNPNASAVVLNGTARFVVSGRPQLIFGDSKTELAGYNESIALNNVTVRPNEFVVLEFPTTSQNFVSQTPLPTVADGETNDEKIKAGWPHYENTPGSTVNGCNPTFHFYFKPQSGQEFLVDMSRQDADKVGGLDRDEITFSTALGGKRNWFARNHLQMYPGREFVGDPRFAVFAKQQWMGSTPNGQYTSSTWWKGRQNIADVRSQDFTANWAQRDYVPRNPSVGSVTGNQLVLPTSVPSAYKPTDDGRAAISVIRNGPMKSIGELGHVYDPVHAGDDLSAPNVLVDPDQAKYITAKSTYIAGGGRTLRLGQPEFSTNGSNAWNTNGRRSTELLDIFTVNPTGTKGIGALGRINPNTASMEVLAAVLGGIEVKSDEGETTRKLVATNIANAIINQRPYSSLSDLYKVLPELANGTNYLPAFTSQYGGGTTNLAAFDRVREEVFGKLIQHLSVQSRTFRIYAVGQSLDAKMNPRGTSILEAIIYLDFDLTSQRFRPIVQYRKFLQ